MKKVYIVCKKEERAEIEEAMKELVLHGVELFFSEKEEISSIEKEKPELIFLDPEFPPLEGSFFRIERPFSKMLSICKKHLDLSDDVLKEIPM